MTTLSSLRRQVNQLKDDLREAAGLNGQTIFVWCDAWEDVEEAFKRREKQLGITIPRNHPNVIVIGWGSRDSDENQSTTG